MIFERGYFDNKVVNETTINESLREVKLFSAKNSYSSIPTVFLSHKHDDLKDLRGVMGLLKELGVKIYIDSMDNKMPEQTSGDTANRIKEVIKYCDKFILLATEKAIESFWCNWELGIGDTHKFMEHIAILPVKEKNSFDHNYKGNEYLQIYPKISYNKSFTNIEGHFFKEGYYVENPIDKNGTRWITELSVWLKK
jgi:predicted peroxiredoxin